MRRACVALGIAAIAVWVYPSAQVSAQAPPVIIEVTELIGVMDAPLALPPVVVDVSETIAATDGPGVLPAVVVDVSETISVSDGIGVVPPVVVELTEAIAVSDAPGVVPPAVVDVSEIISVADVPAVLPGVVIEVLETITVSDTHDVVPPAVIDVTEVITVADVPSLLPGVIIEVNEVITVTDDPQLMPGVVINVNEVIAVADDVDVPQPTGDGDGIADDVDTDPASFSSDFSDVPSGGTTAGAIVSRGDQELTIVEEPNPAGVRIVAGSSGGPTPATVTACDALVEYTLSAGDEMVLTCGSSTSTVIVGPIEAKLSDGVELILPDGAIVTVTKTPEGSLHVDNQSPEGTDPVVIVVDGKPVGTLDAGSSVQSSDIQVDEASLTPQKGGGGQKSKGERSKKSKDSEAPSEFDGFEIRGTLVVPDGGPPIDALSDGAVITFGDFSQTIPADDFKRKEKSEKSEASEKSTKSGKGGKSEPKPAKPSGIVFEFKARGNASGIKRFEIDEAGTFRLEAQDLDLNQLDLLAPVSFSILVGEHLGVTGLQFDAKGNLSSAIQLAPAGLLAQPDLSVLGDSTVLAEGRVVSYTVTVGGLFDGREVTLGCEDLPYGLSCSFAPAIVRPTLGGASSLLTVSQSPARQGSAVPVPVMPSLGQVVLWTLWVALLGFAVFYLTQPTRRVPYRRFGPALPLILLLMSVMLYTACSDSITGVGTDPEPRIVTFTVTATADDIARSAAIELLMQ